MGSIGHRSQYCGIHKGIPGVPDSRKLHMAQLGSFAYKTQDTTVRVISQTAALLHSKHDRGAGRVQNELNSQSARFAGTSQQNLAVCKAYPA